MAIHFVGIPALPPEIAKMLRENLVIVEVIIMYTIGAFTALEVGISSLNLFKRHRGLYFWSMQISAWGILLHTIPSLVTFVAPKNLLASTIIASIGWGCMVNGQPLVLYSRLHLVVAGISRFRWILWMIIFNAIIVYVTMATLVFGVSVGHENFALSAFIWNRTHVFILHAQDLIICVIYIREARRALGPIIASRRFAAPMKTVIYGLKLKLEFAILNRLRSFLSSGTPYVFHGGDHGRGNRQDLNDSNSTTYRRHSSDLNIYTMVNADHRPPYDGVSSMPTPTPTPGLNTFEPDPFASCFQVTMANCESRRKREQESQMGSTHDFHEGIRETSSKDNMNLPASPAPTVASYTSPGSLRSERCSSGSNTRGRIGSSETRSTIEAELLVTPK
ncbi:hypothetical protein N7481_007118 [Penicillium waksmanii]|uniref:uncharacterized protein n=1 Tax=Penicillium waksmanii TaxID=69791 RepID=UPI002546AEEB|nr:uncharacterized protein N7481_007118 [Penicillium waksmanii]KAJ5979820.1 hypothetical protein N7481_007118 [Penicillium waksmanii]